MVKRPILPIDVERDESKLTVMSNTKAVQYLLANTKKLYGSNLSTPTRVKKSQTRTVGLEEAS